MRGSWSRASRSARSRCSALVNGPQPGTVLCDANVSLLLATAGFTAHRFRCIHWAYSVDGGKSFVSAPSTPNGKTTLAGLPSLTIVGVKVSLSTSKGTGRLEPGGDHPGALTGHRRARRGV